ncbi:MAG: RlmE family RNA methyltransferase [Pseudomonadales bacterium]|nr:RlmE family RNA methyltransferase [Pseudomonadales bacterium]
MSQRKDSKKGIRRSKSGSRSKSSARWLERQRKDPFARKASTQGRISRAHFKLEQLDARFRLLKPGMRVLELGAAPGGWTQYVESRIGGSGLLVACDYRPIAAAAATRVVVGEVGAPEVDEQVDKALESGKVDLVLSDMAPNISGIRAADQARSMHLVEVAEAAARRWLKPTGTLVVKIFQGGGVEEWIRQMRKQYAGFKVVKPEASRSDSREMYAVAERFRDLG